jgi:hypothetical protein
LFIGRFSHQAGFEEAYNLTKVGEFDVCASGARAMLTTKFRVWLQDPGIPPVWTGVKVVDELRYVKARYIEVTVEGNGNDLRQLIAQRQDIFAAYLQMKPEKREDH